MINGRIVLFLFTPNKRGYYETPWKAWPSRLMTAVRSTVTLVWAYMYIFIVSFLFIY